MYEQEELIMPILNSVGVCLIILGGASGAALFFRAIWGAKENSTSTSTLWGLFIIGVGAGIILVSVSG